MYTTACGKNVIPTDVVSVDKTLWVFIHLQFCFGIYIISGQDPISNLHHSKVLSNDTNTLHI